MPTPPVNASILESAAPSVARSYPNDNTNVGASIPVYLVDSQAFDADPPNALNVDGAAIPINLTTLDAFPNAIPIRFVTSTGSGPTWGSDQGNDGNSIPVFFSVAPNAQPVWDVTLGIGRAPSATILAFTANEPLNWALVPDVTPMKLSNRMPTVS